MEQVSNANQNRMETAFLVGRMPGRLIPRPQSISEITKASSSHSGRPQRRRHESSRGAARVRRRAAPGWASLLLGHVATRRVARNWIAVTLLRTNHFNHCSQERKTALKLL